MKKYELSQTAGGKKEAITVEYGVSSKEVLPACVQITRIDVDYESKSVRFEIMVGAFDAADNFVSHRRYQKATVAIGYNTETGRTFWDANFSNRNAINLEQIETAIISAGVIGKVAEKYWGLKNASVSEKVKN